MGAEPRVVVIGAGIVGLSTAMALAEGTHPIRPLVVDKEDHVAAHQTGHNSGVIHSGIYYKPGSLKARYTVEGARQLVEFCRQHGVAHEVCGKVVVATAAEELPRLEELLRRAQANGVSGVELIGPERLREIEPHAAGIRALLVPGTGIVDFPGVAARYAERIAQAGGEIRLGSRVSSVVQRAGEWIVETATGPIAATHLINCAGLYSDRIASMTGAVPRVRIIPFRGEYFDLAPERAALVRNLIYPVPDPAFPFLGVHFTRMVRGGVEAGPNAVLGFKREAYRKTDLDPSELWETLAFPGFWKLARRYWRTGTGEFYRSFSKAAFVRALQRLLPAIRAADLSPGGAGVRAQAVDAAGALVDDFSIETGERAIHVLNAPSPAATASLPIGQAIAARAREQFGWN